MERKHFNDYDLLRIIAIVFVVLGHSAWIDSAGEYGALHYQLPENLASAYNGWLMTAQRYLVGWVYGFHMPLFFILSGAVYGISDRYNFDILCWKKIKRLFIPFWIYSLGFTIPLMWLGNFYDNSTVIVAYVNALGGSQPSLMVPASLVLGICGLLVCAKNRIRQSLCLVPAKPACPVLS
jgi:fucose 4-O-acetylase-like acetyltransferase